MSNIKLFEDKEVRAKWNEDEDQWYFVVQDVIKVLTDTDNARDYWYRLKKRTLESEGVDLSTICRQLKFEAKDGKKYKYESANNEAIFRIIQSIPSPKAEPFKRWLAQLGSERIQEIKNPETAVQRARTYYTVKGRDGDWIDQRLTSVATRNNLRQVRRQERGIRHTDQPDLHVHVWQNCRRV